LDGVFTVSLDNAFWDNILWLAGIVAEAAILGLLFYRRVWRTLPVFCVFVAWGLFSDAGTYAAQRVFGGTSTHGYLITYIILTTLDAAMQIIVLIELTWSILRPLRPSLSRRAPFLVGLLIFALGALIWPFAGIHGLAGYDPAWSKLVHVQHTTSILRIVFFLLLAGCSQLLSIGWRDRELQVASGLGFYSIVNLAVDIWSSHQGMGQHYNYVGRILAVAYACSLLYWVFSFSQAEAERREFTPQMQSFLLALAGTARSTRMSLIDSTSVQNRDHRQ
jgi:hypothetical protein